MMTSATIGVFAALGSATTTAVAAALQHRSATDGADSGRPTTGLRRFVHSQLTHRLWWAALPVQLVGLLLHATALGAGSLVLVQPLLVCSMVLAPPIHHYLRREPTTMREVLWATLLVSGVTGFLAIAAPGQTVPSAGPGGPAVLIAALSGVAAIAACWAFAQRASPAPAAVSLAAAAAIAFTGQAAFLQATTAALAHSPLALFDGGAVYGLLASGTGGVVLTQLAFRAGPLAVSLPTMTVLNPILGIVVGVLVNHDTIRHSPAAVTGELVAVAALCVAATALTRQRSEAGFPVGSGNRWRSPTEYEATFHAGHDLSVPATAKDAPVLGQVKPQGLDRACGPEHAQNGGHDKEDGSPPTGTVIPESN
jgi:hypothetical protein